jgi:hypothetical protein
MRRFLIATISAATVAVLASTTNFVSAPVLDPISEWGSAAQTAATASGMAPLRAPITLAILHLAMYDAVNAIDGDRQPYAASPQVIRPASSRSAAIEAGYRVLLEEFPSQKASLDTVYQNLMASEPQTLQTAHGAAVGAAVAAQLLLIRTNDNRNLNVPYTPGAGSGAWIPTPPQLLPATTKFLSRVTPFTMDRPSQFRPAGPPDLNSRRWADDYNEVKTLGVKLNSSRTPAQTATAWFWEPLAGTVWPVSIRRMAKEQALDLKTSARFQAATFAAFADGLIACWDAKFHFNFWRPVTAIREGQLDQSDLTLADPNWEPLANTPNFPEYPSGHACATAAVAHTAEDFFSHQLRIPAQNIFSGEERFYDRAVDVVDEVVEARMLLGLHFRSADEDGADIGRKIARQIRSRWFKQRNQSGSAYLR